MTLPVTPPGKTLETLRAVTRRRLLYGSAFLALGAVLLALAQVFVLAFIPVGATTGLLLGALLQILGFGAGAQAAVAFSRAFPLSESGLSARLALLASLLVVLPVCAAVTVAYVLVALPESPLVGPTNLVLVPAMPLFWGPPSSIAAIGLVYAARELASERMAIVAAIGCGVIVGMTLSASGGAIVDPVGAVRSARLLADLLLVAFGFVVIAFAFRIDAWAARSRRVP